MNYSKRTHNCGELRSIHQGQTVTLNGWVHRIRNHGAVFFFTLRDRYGTTQAVLDEKASQELKDAAGELRMEFCVALMGTVRVRPEANPKMATGEVEVLIQSLQVLSKCPALPFQIEEENKASENLRLEYRYLDLRSQGMQDRLQLRHKVTFATRDYLNQKGFLEIETPTLIKSTPEGARDFLVPSRISPGKFYALPQSPQLYKQLLMVGGMDKYFQIARCYRDEDARGDRQPEFTQIDIEMSFVTRDEVLELTEGLMAHIFQNSLGVTLPLPFQRLSWDEAMNTYGSDKPDLRFGLPFADFSEFATRSDFEAFRNVVKEGGTVKVLRVPGGAEWATRKKIGELEEAAKVYGAKGLAWMKVTAEGLEGGVSKFFGALSHEIIQKWELVAGDALFLMADQWKTAVTALGAVRNRIAKDLGLIQPGTFSFLWVVDFPLFDFNTETQAWEPAHHMFSMPQAQFLDTFDTNPGPVKGDLYDLVCNGLELASGSIRIHDPELQQRLFNVVGFPQDLARERFGFLLDAFQYGPPPHGGIAPGLDRLLMIMSGQESIREVIAFPKNTQAASPMDGSPGLVDEKQVKDLGIVIQLKE